MSIVVTILTAALGQTWILPEDMECSPTTTKEGYVWREGSDGEGECTVDVRNSITPPATCDVGMTYFDSDAAAGSKFLLCTASNTWTGMDGDAEDQQVYQTDLLGGDGAESVTGNTWTGISDPFMFALIGSPSVNDVFCVKWTLDVACASQNAQLRIDNLTEANRVWRVEKDASSTWTDTLDCWGPDETNDFAPMIGAFPTDHAELKLEARFDAPCVGSTLTILGVPVWVVH